MLKTALIGSQGRMGQTLLGLAAAHEVDFVATLDAGDDLANGLSGAAAAIDFSAPAATVTLAQACAEKGVALVSGTTGLSAAEQTIIAEVATKVPVVQAGNFSVGVNTLFWLVEKAADTLGPDYVAEIMEIHHRHKKDAPSGTAMDLAYTLQAVKELPESALRHGREGQTGARPADEIALHALRGGEVVGEHTVFFFGPHDRLELTHRASDRGIFAAGALRAARWAAAQAPGLYSMRDVLSLR